MADVYEITDVRERRVLGPDGRVSEMVQLTFTTKPGGATGTVDVPKVGYDATVADAAVRPYAIELERTRAL